MINYTELNDIVLKIGAAILGLIIFIWTRKIILGKQRFF